MSPGERLKKYEECTFDEVIMKIKHGVIKSGKYSHLIKIDKDAKLPKKGVLFKDGSDAESS